MAYTETDLAAAKNLLQSARRIVILSHRGPDGDTVGANLGLRLALEQQWNKAVTSACIDPSPESADFLPKVAEYQRDFDQSQFDAIVFVDCGASYMTKFHEIKPQLLSKNPPILNIDHHASNDFFGTINLVDAEAAAACQVVYRFLKFCGFKIDRHIATCLLHGLYFDTGSFMHSNTSPEVLEIAAELMWKGADFKTIVRKQFHTMPVPQLKLFGKIMERTRVNSKGVTVSAVSAKDYEEAGAEPNACEGAIDYLNSVPEGSFSCLIHEDRKGGIKGSLRTRVDDLDLSQIAGMFGGGGHKKASGFSFPGHLLEVGQRVTIGE